MRSPSIVNGWLVVPYTGTDAADVRIGVGTREPLDALSMLPAFLDWVGTQRVAKIRVPSGASSRGVSVWISINNAVRNAGVVAP